jgi:aminopeptidase
MTHTHSALEALTAQATTNIEDIVRIALNHTEEHQVLVVYDTESELAQVLLNAYKNVLPNARYMDFNAHAKEDIISAFDALTPRDLVVLIQSTDFRLNQFRIRIYLFQKKLKVIDHLHLLRNTPDSWETYVHALAYDTDWYRGTGRRLKSILEDSSTLRVLTETTELRVEGKLEEPKLNIGDYTGMENIGGTFPIGEVFTEAKDLSTMNGSLMIYAFADASYNVAMHEPFRIDIKEGILIGWGENAPESFTTLVEEVRAHERAIIREVGFGLNRAITREHYLKDITAFERILGMHFSLGEKHTVYKKEGIKADKTRYHVDLFPVVDTAYADDTCVFDGHTYVV